MSGLSEKVASVTAVAARRNGSHVRPALDSVVVVATIFPDPERRSEVMSMLERVTGVIHSGDAGCEIFALHEGEDRVVVIEKWRDAEALAAHRQDADFAALVADITGLLSAPSDIQILTPRPAGATPQGAL